MKFVQARYYYRNGNTPKYVVIHDMEYPKKPGAAAWCADYFATSSPENSAHYCADAGEIIQCVEETDGAWHTPGFLNGEEVNRISIGVEHAGYARQSEAEWLDEYSRPMLEKSAALVAGICQRFNIPAVHVTPDELRAGKTGICGHVDMTYATGTGSHVDPGTGFPWDWFIEQVNANLDESSPSRVAMVAKTALPFLAIAGLLGLGAYVITTASPALSFRRLLLG